MCWQDIQIARRTRYTAFQTQIAADKAYLFIPYNKFRYALIIGTNGSDVVTISPDKNMLGGIGQNLFPSYPGVMCLNLRDHGDLCRAEWWARTASQTISLPYFESVLNETDWAELEQLERAEKARWGNHK